MTGNQWSHNKRLILCLLIFIGFSGSITYSQVNLSGNFNQPHSHISSISGPDRIIVDNVAGFSASDTILLIQMQGVEVYTDPGLAGTVGNIYGEPGLHEFLIIQSINIGTREIIFRNNIINSYDQRGNIQIVRAPYFNSVNITGELFCNPWDSVARSGGVLTMIVGGTLKLQSDINVSGLGFKGGKDTIGDGNCYFDNILYQQDFYPRSYTNAGYKGEGIANFVQGTLPFSPGYMKGQAPSWTGGGGGNSRYSGGGGGSNRGDGGLGGLEDCSTPWVGGTGGYKAYYGSLSENRIYLGGGGGASTRSLTGSGSQGGNGGGIVIIVADTISGEGGNILASGEDGGNAVGIGGSGGGGAGGSVALYVKSFGFSAFNIKASGGNGGDNPGPFGDGGGGSGGLIYINNDLPANVTDSLAGGYAGNHPSSTGEDGTAGEKRLGFMALLNGFLYNTIRSSVTGDQIDSICSNVLPPMITGTQPVGGTGPYTYVWEKSYDAAFTSPIVLTNDPDPTNYTPTMIETSNVWYRRTITDQSIPALVDISKPVEIIVQPQILNNVIVANPDTICINSDPAIITQGVPDLFVPSISYLKYIWQDSTDGGTWGPELAPETAKEFDPDPAGGLSVNTWYRRTVISGRCKDNTGIVKFSILPDITDNGFAQLFDTICFGGNTSLVPVTGPSGGVSGDYRYLWQQSNTGTSGSWSTLTGENQSTFDPDATVSLPAGDHFYRRIVLSGEQDACKDTSGPATRKVWPVISNNIINSNQIIGYDSIPTKLVESLIPTGGAGSGTYDYKWVKDTVNLPFAPGPNPIDQNEYQPPNLRWTTSFMRIISSSACADTSNPVLITVDTPIANTISIGNSNLDTIYTGQLSSQINGSVPTGGSAIISDGYSFKWYKSTAEVPSDVDWSEITGSITQYDPGALTQSTWFRRDVSSPAITPRSTYRSNYIRVTVLPEIINRDIQSDQDICYGMKPLQLTGNSQLAGGDGTYTFTWRDSTSAHTWQNIPGYVKVGLADYGPPALTSTTGYRRIVYSGKNDCGVETSNSIIIKVDPLPGVPYAGPDQEIYSIDKAAQLNANPPLTGETGLWEVLDPNSGSLSNNTYYSTQVTGLSPGVNYFKWTVITDIGNCKLSDSVKIVLNNDFIPSGFSPNGDGVNDMFIIEGLNLSAQKTAVLKIVNGAGTEVFSTSNINGETWSDWDGKNTRGIDLPDGTYYYLFKLISDGQVYKRTGFIILKRN